MVYYLGLDYEEEKCEDCGATWSDKDIHLVHDEDGRCLCTDCFFERQCEGD